MLFFQNTSAKPTIFGLNLDGVNSGRQVTNVYGNMAFFTNPILKNTS